MYFTKTLLLLHLFNRLLSHLFTYFLLFSPKHDLNFINVPDIRILSAWCFYSNFGANLYYSVCPVKQGSLGLVH